MVDQISSAISFVAVLALIAGLGVLMAIVSHQANERRLSFALLKTLGAKSDKIMQIYLFEYLLLAVGAIALGTLLSLVLSIVLSLYVFKTGVTVHWLVPSLIAATVLPVSLILTYLFSRSALNASVNKLLQ